MKSSRKGGWSAGNTGEPSGVNTHTESNDCQLPDGRGGETIVKNRSYCLKSSGFQRADTHGNKATHARARVRAHTQCDAMKCVNVSQL